MRKVEKYECAYIAAYNITLPLVRIAGAHSRFLCDEIYCRNLHSGKFTVEISILKKIITSKLFSYKYEIRN